MILKNMLADISDSAHSIYYKEEDRKLRLGKLVIERTVRYRSNKAGNKVGKEVSYRLWVGGFLYISGLRMLFREIANLYRLSKPPANLQNEINLIVSWRRWPKCEWWRKAVNLWARLIYPAEYKKEELGQLVGHQ